MKSIHIRNIEPRVLEALKRLAKTNHRSLQGELLFILENAARLAPRNDESNGLDLVTINTGSREPMGREDIYEDGPR